MKLSPIANRIAADCRDAPWINDATIRNDMIRNLCDIATGQELSTRTLDRLEDMTLRRLAGVIQL